MVEKTNNGACLKILPGIKFPVEGLTGEEIEF